MKTKIEAFVKKIKNWLSSLSKWAKKHIVPLILVLLFILTMGLTCFSRNKMTASAQALYSSDIVFATSPFIVSTNDSSDLVFLPFFFGYDSQYGMEGSYIDVPISQNWETGNITYSRNYLYYYTNGSYLETSTFDFVVRSLDNTNMWYSLRNENGVATSYCSISVDTSNAFNGNICEYLFNNAVRYNVDFISGVDLFGNNKGNLRFNFFSSSGVPCCNIYVHNCYPATTKYSIIQCPPIFISSNTDLVAVADELLQNAYSNGYNVGYNNGYNEAYDLGFNAGIDYSVDPTHFEPFFIITRGVTDFLNFELMGSVSVGTILSIGFGILLLGFAIKIFLGG